MVAEKGDGKKSAGDAGADVDAGKAKAEAKKAGVKKTAK